MSNSNTDDSLNLSKIKEKESSVLASSAAEKSLNPPASPLTKTSKASFLKTATTVPNVPHSSLPSASTPLSSCSSTTSAKSTPSTTTFTTTASSTSSITTTSTTATPSSTSTTKTNPENTIDTEATTSSTKKNVLKKTKPSKRKKPKKEKKVIPLLISNMMGETYTINVNILDCSVDDLKWKIYTETNIEPLAQHLLLVSQGKELIKGQLKDYNINEYTKLTLQPKVKSGLLGLGDLAYDKSLSALCNFDLDEDEEDYEEDDSDCCRFRDFIIEDGYFNMIPMAYKGDYSEESGQEEEEEDKDKACIDECKKESKKNHKSVLEDICKRKNLESSSSINSLTSDDKSTHAKKQRHTLLEMVKGINEQMSEEAEDCDCSCHCNCLVSESDEYENSGKRKSKSKRKGKKFKGSFQNSNVVYHAADAQTQQIMSLPAGSVEIYGSFEQLLASEGIKNSRKKEGECESLDQPSKTVSSSSPNVSSTSDSVDSSTTTSPDKSLVKRLKDNFASSGKQEVLMKMKGSSMPVVMTVE
eukprot:Awhi_evm1s14258